MAEPLAERLLAGDVRALARAIRMVEDRDPGVPALVRAVRRGGTALAAIGITGPPGSGKSTVCDQLIGRWRERGESVAVLAVDPSSPFSGGALLGDRVRMQRHAGDPGVYIRSMAARGHLGGLALATREAVRLLAAAGWSRCLLETVGVGQSELEVMRTADTTVVVVTPAAGDAVQIMKAGILEIADVFAVNKADLPGAARVGRELREMVAQSRPAGAWSPPVVEVTATTGAGVDGLVAAIDSHREVLEAAGELRRRRAERLRAEVEAIVVERAAERVRRAIAGGTMELDESADPAGVDPYSLADRVLDWKG